MEALGMVLIAALACTISRQTEGIAAALLVLGVLALGAQCLLPALQHICGAWASIAGSHASPNDTIALLDQPLPAEHTQPAPAPPLNQNAIRSEAVRFRDTTDGSRVLDGLNLTILRGARVGSVGSTARGESTTLDLSMGLLLLVEGERLVDGQNISGNLLSGGPRQRVGIVPELYKQASVLVLDEAPSALDNAIAVVAQGSYEQLVECSPSFRRMAGGAA